MSGAQDPTDNPLGGRRKLAPVSRSAFNGGHPEGRSEQTHAPSAGGSHHPLRGGRSKLAPVGGSSSAAGDTSVSGSKLPPIEEYVVTLPPSRVHTHPPLEIVASVHSNVHFHRRCHPCE
eukprot:TRINITY_DN33468_c0_g1_i1.p1 TRINITY_DN33468_c0_g1~~TRINITY_DN33468_c0_g1_i1.p1  ORF type:complete len:119 (+),score=12.39 TRINITY_DN33468_c0_g1_i1:163-519(+)